MIMTTFAGWLSDQNTRQDAVGEIARLWAQISPGRTHSVQGVTKAILEYAEQHTLAWVPEAIAATAEEYRTWKVNPEGSSIAAPQTRSQLDRIEGMLARLLDSLGIPLADLELAAKDGIAAVPDGVVIPITAQAGLMAELGPQPPDGAPETMVPYIKAEGGLGMRPAGSLSALKPGSTEPDPWAALYASASHDLPEDAELGEQAE